MLSPAGIAERLTRAKTASLPFEAMITYRNHERLDVCERELGISFVSATSAILDDSRLCLSDSYHLLFP
jgi:hypothetical protein